MPGIDISDVSAVNQELARIWAEVLYRPPSGPDENFFDAGADSFNLIELDQKIRTRFGLDIPVESLSRDCTIRNLAALISATESAPSVSNPSEAIGYHLAGRRDFPLLDGQRTLLGIEQLPVRSAFLNSTYLFSVSGPLRTELLQRGLSDIIESQPFLRCGFRIEDGRVSGMHLIDRVSASLPVYDYSDSSAASGREKLQELVAKTAGTEFDVETGPLWAGSLARVGPEEHALVFVVHHLVFDNPSMRIFFRTLFERYAAQPTGKPTTVEPYSLEKLYTAQAASDQSVSVPTTVPPHRAYAGRRQSLLIDRVVSESLRKASNTAATGCLAAFFSQLLRIEGFGSVTVGTSLDVRKQQGADGMIGCLLRHAELRCEGGPETPLSSLVEQARIALGRAMDSETPTISFVPGKQAWPHSFVFYTDRLGTIEAGPLRVRALDSYMGFTKRDLTLRVVQDSSEGTLDVCLECNAARFSSDEASAILNSFAQTVRAIAATPETRLGDLASTFQKSSGAA